ncbi:PH domain-containing protein [Neobacillus thermocopriae]|uniref:PH domain-containing protein n=1 Tax=Neobacillus thermocopriae TaxID=1215031 RepID=A0A6B3TU95_9BACI|nr:PH domain-containing protein [Neobacillus thermocopriae]MED3622919.1 PH domain-containing protein [Neobacillus thermocopriae]MED3713193.1 PH domain-containing protein [Neobacillus thermocopriae]NEX79217.1 PH domain-containing protein [Neobacillus thermocopriae]
MRTKRFHPLLMVFEVWQLLKNTFFIFIFLFIMKANSHSLYIKYGRIIFIIFLGLALLYIVLKWITHTYALDDRSFHLYQGVLSKTERTIPFSKIQNVTRHTTFFHQLFQVTSIRFETGMNGEDAAVKFDVVSQTEAKQMEEHMARALRGGVTDSEIIEQMEEDPNSSRIIHFKPTKRDVFRASFTSFSFFVIIPILTSFYLKIDEIFHVNIEAEGIFYNIISSWWLLTIIIIVFIIISVAFGMAWTFFKYGKYEISSDQDRIYIAKGIIEETAFSIAKDRVQAVEIEQSFMKRCLGLAEVKLTSAGGHEIGEEKSEVNSLYPFLPKERAYEMIDEILPAYRITPQMQRLPKKSLWVRLLRPYWIWGIVTIVLYYFKPEVWGVERAWWLISAILLFINIALRWINFLNTQYVLHDGFIQLKTGSLTTSLFVTKRDKVIEIEITRNIFQKWLGLASIEMVNRSKPVKHSGIKDVPVEFADAFYQWYLGRKLDITIE